MARIAIMIANNSRIAIIMGRIAIMIANNSKNSDNNGKNGDKDSK